MFFIKVIAAALLIQTKPLIIERKTKKEQKTKQNKTSIYKSLELNFRVICFSLEIWVKGTNDCLLFIF